MNAPPGQDVRVVYDIASARIHTDGTVVMPGSWWNGEIGGGGVVLVEPDDPDYEFSRWLIANRELIPQVNNENAAATFEAFKKQRTADELERKVAPDHGLPDL